MKKDMVLVSGTLLDDDTWFSLREVCRCCDVNAELIMEMVAEGVVEPQGSAPPNWRFGGPAVVRIQTALRLQKDLKINLPGAALALDLLEELEELRRLYRGSGHR